MLGLVDIFPAAMLAANQFRLGVIEGAPERWIVFAQVLYQPILISRDGDRLALLEDNDSMRNFGVLDEFLAACLDASRYARFAPGLEPDEWQRLLEKHP